MTAPQIWTCPTVGDDTARRCGTVAPHCRTHPQVRIPLDQLLLPQIRRTTEVAWNIVSTGRSIGVQYDVEYSSVWVYISHSIYCNWKPTTILNTTTWPHFKLLFLQEISTMRFIAFVIASATLTFNLFNTCAYAMPAELSSLDSAKHLQADWCGGYDDVGCAQHCSANGYQQHVCSLKYAQTRFHVTSTWCWHVKRQPV